MMRKAREKISPDLTPVIDIVFILLIFFMVTSVFKKEDVLLALSLPTLSSSATVSKDKSISIELSEDKLAIDSKEYSFIEAQYIFSKYKKDKKILIRIDKKVHYERVMKLFDELQKQQLNSFSLVANEK